MLFRQKNRWGLTVLSVVLSLVLAPYVSVGLFMPQVLPILMLAMLGFVGPASVVVCGAVLVGVCGFFYGLIGGICMALLIVPVLVASTVLVERRTGFFVSAGICAGVMFASVGVILALISFMAGTDVVTALSEMIRVAFDAMGEEADPLLMLMSQFGMGSLLGSTELGQLAEGVALSAQTRAEMINTFVYVTNVYFRIQLPVQMTVGSLAAGVLGQAVLRRGTLARGISVPYPPLRTWRLPSGWGRVLGGTLAVLYVAAMLTSGMTVMASVFNGVFTELFALQGIAALAYKLHETGKGRRWSALIFILGYFILRPAATIVGIADQAFDFTRRRAALDTEDNPYDPRARL